MASSTFSFDRIYQILIGEKQGTSINPVVVIEPQHHIEMQIVESIPNSGSSLSPCQIKLFNIGIENVQSLSRKDLTVVVKAGYKFEDNLIIEPNDAQVVYQGDLVDAVHDNTGTDVVSTLICQEGHHSAIQVKLKATEPFAKGTLVSSAFRKLLSYMPYTSEIRFQGMDTLTFQKDISAPNGQLIKALDYLCNKASQPDKGIVVTWMFNRGKILILDRRPKTVTRSFIKHNIPRSRIKGTVDISFDEKTTTPQTSNVGISEIKIRTFLLPEITIGDTILIESSERENYYQDTVTGNQEFSVVGVTTVLSYDRGAWDSIITGRIKE